MTPLNREAVWSLARFPCILGVLLFGPAWTLDYWQAWVFIAVVLATVTGITVYLMVCDPALLARRIRAGPGVETEKRQKIIVSVELVPMVAIVILPAFDHRFGWSVVPPAMVGVGDGLIALGMLMTFFVLRANRFAASTIVVQSGQIVISTGPYAVVRHPMYSAALIVLAGVPPALGSWWGLVMLLPIALGLAWRLLDEERFLVEKLAGYAAYRETVRWRLVPGVW